jgi:hypothetical protein
MVRANRSRHAVIVILSSGFAFLAFGGCSDGVGTRDDECGPNQIRTCKNRGFGEDCDCSIVVGAGGTAGVAGTGSIIDGEAGVGGSLGASGYGGIGGADGAVPSGRLGAACTSDADCVDLTCITASSSALGGEGPARGLCTASCADDIACSFFGPKAVCVNFGSDASPARYCVERCSFGPMGSGPNPNKCHGREEMACAPLLRSTGLSCSTDSSCALPDHFCGGNQCIDASPVCLPQCNADTDCLAAGRSCNPKTGLCRPSPSTGLPLGEECTYPANGGTDACIGRCTSITYSVSGSFTEYTCSGGCTIGAQRSCGWAGPASEAPASALCMFSIPIVDKLGGSGAGDRGSCAQLCNCNSECLHPEFVCMQLPADLQSATRRQGYCALTLELGIFSCG